MNNKDFESVSESSEMKLSGFQNELLLDNPRNADLMPKIRFVADENETEEDFEGKILPGFQNETLDIKVENHENTPSADVSCGDYCGPSSAALEIKIESATKDLTYAQEQLEKAIENGTGVITAMNLVENAQKLLDTYTQLYGEAVAAEAEAAAEQVTAAVRGKDSGIPETGEVRLGSVSHAQWELEKAYESGNSIRIHNAEKNLAHEKAKEAAKK